MAVLASERGRNGLLSQRRRRRRCPDSRLRLHDRVRKSRATAAAHKKRTRTIRTHHTLRTFCMARGSCVHVSFVIGLCVCVSMSMTAYKLAFPPSAQVKISLHTLCDLYSSSRSAPLMGIHGRFGGRRRSQSLCCWWLQREEEGRKGEGGRRQQLLLLDDSLVLDDEDGGLAEAARLKRRPLGLMLLLLVSRGRASPSLLLLD